jgi:hypothetical protein
MGSGDLEIGRWLVGFFFLLRFGLAASSHQLMLAGL